ncbi:Hypothetical Protein FCC1311_034812 [Hondaea fermentalgiana]|uniref:Uncharacterized protein n=1 Tax=Hondaea fermentalgiana TaxID=2315210 RepID=A0A2R5GAD9_9STRA|nr:Hypothetical Protein FCC1311_034812 [Hondaea fermentalgiana]|eukprot:GBG27259.1 Hypothetical Protein FCC1311_034812 [Hondaea fermentalgiana]
MDTSFQDVFARFACDATAGAIAGATVTPVVSAVDRALAESASGKGSLWPSFFAALREYAARPIAYLKGPQFFYVWAVYGGTYCAANLVDTVCGLRKVDPAMPKLATTTATNTVASMMKDRAFAQLFGTSVASGVPPAAYAAWLSRDAVSMSCFFTLPPIVGGMLSEYTENGYYYAQVTLPLAVQFLTSPIHLLGYNIYNQPNATVASRIAFMRKDYLRSVALRCVRQAPPWSFGTIGNTEIKGKLQRAAGLKPLVPSTPVYHVSG